MRLTPSRVSIVTVAVLVAVALQASLLARLPLPGGTPNLVLVLVVAIGLSAGMSAGMTTGFFAGLLCDLLSDHPVGILALCFAVAGFLAGLLDTDTDRSVARPLVVVAAAAATSYLLYVGLLALLARPAADGVGGLPSTVLYDVMLTPFVVPVVSALTRHLELELRR